MANYFNLPSMLSSCRKPLDLFCRRSPYSNPDIEESSETNSVYLDISRSGQDTVIVKNGCRLCGTGTALCNVALLQNKSYFEAKIQCTGVWSIGVCLLQVDVNSVPLGVNKLSWALSQDGCVYHNGTVLARCQRVPQEGDLISVLYDHVTLQFLINGTYVNCAVHNSVKGEVFPAFCVDSGAIIDVFFSRFFHEPPPGYGNILVEKSII